MTFCSVPLCFEPATTGGYCDTHHEPAEPRTPDPLAMFTREFLPMPWIDEANCKGKGNDLFFAPHNEKPAARKRRETQARTICAGCPVKLPCRRHARTHGEVGWWGGEGDEDRARLGILAMGMSITSRRLYTRVRRGA